LRMGLQGLVQSPLTRAAMVKLSRLDVQEGEG